jgi:hypothetical protein
MKDPTSRPTTAKSQTILAVDQVRFSIKKLRTY